MKIMDAGFEGIHELGTGQSTVKAGRRNSRSLPQLVNKFAVRMQEHYVPDLETLRP
jgi:hypothetical protein